LHTKPSLVPAWNFYYGPIPLHNRMDTYCVINRAEWAIPWNSGVLQFKKGPHPPPLCLGWMKGRMDGKDDHPRIYYDGMCWIVPFNDLLFGGKVWLLFIIYHTIEKGDREWKQAQR
jgi:hypothetical protein